MERFRGKYAMHGLLDGTTQLTNLKSETRRPESLTCKAALETALAATLLFPPGQMLFERVLRSPGMTTHGRSMHGSAVQE